MHGVLRTRPGILHGLQDTDVCLEINMCTCEFIFEKYEFSMNFMNFIFFQKLYKQLYELTLVFDKKEKFEKKIIFL